MISNSLCSKYNTSNLKKQDSNKNYLQSYPELSYSLPVHLLTECDQAILNYFLFMSEKYHILYPSQGKMAEKLGYNRQYLNERIKILCENKFLVKITKYYSKDKSYTIYRIPPLVSRPKIKELFSWTYKTFKAIALSWSLSAYNNNIQLEISALNSKNPTQVKVFNLLNIVIDIDIDNNISLDSKKSVEDLKKVIEKNSNRKVSSLNSQNEFSLPLSETKELIKNRFNLTRYGIIELYQFEDEALMHALSQIKFTTKTTRESLFGIFCSYAYKWHQAKGIPKNREQHSALLLAYPIPMDGLKTQTLSAHNSSTFKQKSDNINNNNFKKKIIYPEPLPGLPEDTLARIKARRDGTYIPVVETREEAAAKIDTYLASEQGQKMQKILGNLTNPFLDKPKKEVTPNIKSNGFIKNLNSALNFNQDNGFNNFYD